MHFVVEVLKNKHFIKSLLLLLACSIIVILSSSYSFILGRMTEREYWLNAVENSTNEERLEFLTSAKRQLDRVDTIIETLDKEKEVVEQEINSN